MRRVTEPDDWLTSTTAAVACRVTLVGASVGGIVVLHAAASIQPPRRHRNVCSETRNRSTALTVVRLPTERYLPYCPFVRPLRTTEADDFFGAFGRRIRRLRLDRDLSQKHLGERGGLDRQMINRLETAAHAISTAHLGALARALEVPPQDLMPTATDFDSKPTQGRAPSSNSMEWSKLLQRAQARHRALREESG